MKKSILVVDDDDGIRLMLRRALSRLGHVVHEAQDGNAAVRFLETTPVALLITDLLMPDCEGVELIMRLKKSCPELPVIAMSGGGMVRAKDYLEIAKTCGAKDVLEKPFEIARLQAAVERILGPTPS